MYKRQVWNDLGLTEFEKEWVHNVSSNDVKIFNENILDNIDRVSEIKIFGGEPVLLDRMWEFLDKVEDDDAKQIDIVMSTNLTQIKHKDWSLLDIDKKFKSLKLMVSCDHYGEQLEFIRYPIDVKQFEQNLQIMKDYIIFIACTVSVLNVFDLKKIEEYYKDFAVSFEPVYSPKSLSIKNIPNKEILRIKVLGKKIVNGEMHILESNFDYVFSVLNGKIDEGTIKNLFTTIRNDDKKIDISFKIPDKVLTGSKYDIDIIINKPLEEVIIAGAIKPHQVNSFFEQEILLEPLASGGIFKMTRAPSKPGIQIWSGIIAHPEGMITFTKSIDIVDKI